MPVRLAPEPATFNVAVREKGLAWLKAQGLPLVGPLPPRARLQPYWRECLPDLHIAYESVCAFAAVRMEPVTSNPTVEHFRAKSRYAEHAYEWDNYRLVCGLLNGAKREFEDVLDPCQILQGTFELDAALQIHPGSTTEEPLRTQARNTIERLKLNNQDRIDLRALYWTAYLKREISARWLRHRSPFVAAEMERLGLLDPNAQALRP